MRTISAFELKEMMDKGNDFILIDFRSSIVYERERIPSAIHMNLGQLKEAPGELDKSKKIVVYCSNPDCMSGRKAAAILNESGYNVLDFVDGIESWKEAGFPVENMGG